jgi:hypothetical protein
MWAWRRGEECTRIVLKKSTLDSTNSVFPSTGSLGKLEEIIFCYSFTTNPRLGATRLFYPKHNLHVFAEQPRINTTPKPNSTRRVRLSHPHYTLIMSTTRCAHSKVLLTVLRDHVHHTSILANTPPMTGRAMKPPLAASPVVVSYKSVVIAKIV